LDIKEQIAIEQCGVKKKYITKIMTVGNINLYENRDNWILECDLDDEFVSELQEFLDKNIDSFRQAETDRLSTAGKGSIQYWIKNHYGDKKMFQKISYKLENKILNLLKKTNILKDDIEITILPKNSWTIVGKENGYHTTHCHTDGSVFGLSCVIYTKVEYEEEYDGKGGDIYFIMNADCASSHTFQTKKQYHIFTPTKNKMFLFPGWLLHGTYPQPKGIRQTFNYEFDLIPHTKKVEQTPQIKYS